MKGELIYKSKKNVNSYHLYSDKIVVYTSSGKKEIPLPVDPMTFMYYLSFEYMYYDQDTLFVVLGTRGPYDQRFAVDEDSLELKGPPIPTY